MSSKKYETRMRIIGGTVQRKIRLSPLQLHVLDLIKDGQYLMQPYKLHTNIEVNGKHVCYLSTIKYLLSKGMIREVGERMWQKI